ncbi:hypothetical protein [Calidifontibacter terrae]
MNEDSNSNDDSGLGKAWWASAVVVLAVLAGLVAVLLNRHHDSTGQTAPSSSAASSAASSDASTATSSTTGATAPVGDSWPDAGCNGSSGSSGAPQQALLAVTWQPVGTVSLPSSKDLGPTTVNGPVRSCFQHSPAGAVVAAANTFGALTASNFRQVLTQRMTAGTGRDQTMADTQATDFEGGIGQFQGYKLNGCSPTACNLSLAVQSSGLWGQEDFSLVWSGGDWKLNGDYPLAQIGPMSGGLPQGWVAWTP